MGHSATGGNYEAPSTLPQGWHPEPVDDVALLRAELDACRAEIARLRTDSVPRSALVLVGSYDREAAGHGRFLSANHDWAKPLYVLRTEERT